VVRGNYVVGGVIFLILSIIQFVVIAKGSERVAEVGARFTLDAMPGKQMAIDAELRAGSIDGNVASQRRKQLSRESQFYGAMDGAMKFVKGDVIASFIIAVINILGGLAIGVLQRDMSITDALKRYGLLTIGDGLVSQIPSLVLSTAAGILVTRVASEESDAALGKELGQQLLRTPKALTVAGIFVGGLGLVPGLPGVPLLVIGGALIALSRSHSNTAQRQDVAPEMAAAVQRDPQTQAQRFVPVVVPWSLDCSADLAPYFDDTTKGERLVRPGLRSVGNAIREVVFRDLGVPLPANPLQVDASLPNRTVVVSLFEVPALSVNLAPELGEEQLARSLMDRVLPLLRRRASEFLGIAETQALLDRLEAIAPATVRQVVPKPVTLTLLTDVLRRLVDEGINVRDLKGILEALSQVAQNDKDALNLTEYVRAQFKRAITWDATRGSRELAVVLLDHAIEDTLRESITRTAAGSFLSLGPKPAREIVEAVNVAFKAATSSGPAVSVILTQPDVRRFVRKLIEIELPEVRVLSYAELLPELSIRARATARVGGRAPA
jgi:type III secretion protein V